MMHLLREIDATTSVCLVIGDPVAHSLSPLVHNAAYHAAGISKKFVYVAAHVRTTELPSAIQGVRGLGIRGVSCTIPHKQAVIRFLDSIDERAESIGAVNTVVNDGGMLRGFNTDLDGILGPLEALGPLKRSKVAIVGAGGAARAAVFGLLSAGAKPSVFNRSKDRAEELGKAADVPCSTLTADTDFSGFDVIINATSVGMSPNVDESPLMERQIASGQIVFDTVYTPLDTKLLKLAAARGARAVRGAEMFVAQAAAQFKLFTDHDAPVEVMREVLLEKLAIRSE
jgi:shikimate dehydrogenase